MNQKQKKQKKTNYKDPQMTEEHMLAWKNVIKGLRVCQTCADHYLPAKFLMPI